MTGVGAGVAGGKGDEATDDDDVVAVVEVVAVDVAFLGMGLAVTAAA